MNSEPLDLAETRLIHRARRGEPDALRMLWDQHLALLWSIAQPMLGSDAVDGLTVLRTQLRLHAPGMALRPVREQLLEMLWGILVDRLQPTPPGGIEPHGGPLPGGPLAPDAEDRVVEALSEAPEEIRLVYLFTFLGQLSTSHVARMSGWPEPEVRRARTWMAWRLVEASHGG